MAARYFLLYFICISSCLVDGQSSKYALKGGEVSLRPDISGHPDGILWKYNGNKVVKFNGKEQEDFSPYENRITLDWVSADLEITDLRFEDSGNYELDVDINKVLHRSVYKLEVIDAVAKPTISCEMNDAGSSNVSGELLCSAEPRPPQSLMTFEWRTHGDVQPGPQLRISLGEQHDDEVYSCRVSNFLSSEEATFTSKDCYPDESSSVILIVCLVIAFLLLALLVGLAILFCKLRHKACFAKPDLENPSPPGRTEGSDRKNGQIAERRPLVHRESTLPSTQPLGRFFQGNRNMRPDESASNQKQDTDSDHDTVKEHMHNEEDEKPEKGHFQNILLAWQRGGADAGQHRESSEEEVPQSDPSDSEKDNEPEPAGVSDHFSEDTQSDPKVLFSLEHPEPEREADEDEEDEEAPSAPAEAETSPAAQPLSPLTESSPNTAPKDTSGEDEEVANPDQVTGESAEKQVRESDSSGEGDRKESDDSSEDEQRGSRTFLHDLNLSQEETTTSKDNTQETVEPVSEDKDKRKTDGVSDHEESDLYSASSQHPQSPTPTKPDNRNTDTCPESPDSAHAPPDEEEDLKTCTDSDETEGQSDKMRSSVAFKEKTQGNESCSGDEAGQKKDEVVA